MRNMFKKKPDLETFTDQSEKTTVTKSEIIRPGDWILRWSPHEADDVTSGFSLFTPNDHNMASGRGPLGGLGLSAVFFMLENGERGFVEEIVSGAQRGARRLDRRGAHTPVTPCR